MTPKPRYRGLPLLKIALASAFRHDDLYEFGEKQIFRDWHWCYEQRKLIDSVRAVNE